MATPSSGSNESSPKAQMKFSPYQIRAGTTLRGNPFNLPGRALIILALVNAAENTKTEGSGRDFSRRRASVSIKCSDVKAGGFT